MPNRAKSAPAFSRRWMRCARLTLRWLEINAIHLRLFRGSQQALNGRDENGSVKYVLMGCFSLPLPREFSCQNAKSAVD